MNERTSSIRSVAGVNFIFGLWLLISPYILGYTTSQSKWQQSIAGIVVMLLALVRYGSPAQLWASWINALVGIWMIIAPYATNYQAGAAYWNEVIFGILIAVLGFANAMTHPSGTTSHHGTHHMAT